MKLRTTITGALCHAELHRDLPHNNLGFGAQPVLVVFEEKPNGDFRRMRVVPRRGSRRYRLVRASGEELRQLHAHGFQFASEN